MTTTQSQPAPQPGTSLSGNPFADGATYNRTRQGVIIRQDPYTARRMIVEAGKNPKEWGLSE
jgi:hypothetical protein